MKTFGIIMLFVVSFSFFIIPTPAFAAYLGSESLYLRSNVDTSVNNSKYDSTGGSYTVCTTGVNGSYVNFKVREEDPGGTQSVFSAIAFDSNPCFTFSTSNYIDGSNNKAELVFYFNTGINEYITAKFYD